MISYFYEEIIPNSAINSDTLVNIDFQLSDILVLWESTKKDVSASNFPDACWFKIILSIDSTAKWLVKSAPTNIPQQNIKPFMHYLE